MIPAPLPTNETKRVEALRRYQILDTAPEQAFDDLAILASTICQTPIALMSLVDTDREWYKAQLGLEGTQSPRELSFCSHAILKSEVMVVDDAALDARFADHPSVLGDPHIRFYAGAPLIDAEGYALGSLCVVDHRPRTLTPEQREALQALGRLVISQMELRRLSADLAESLTDLKTLRGLVPICAHCKVVRNDAGFWESVETYITAHSDAKFSHGVCPACVKLHYGDI